MKSVADSLAKSSNNTAEFELDRLRIKLSRQYPRRYFRVRFDVRPQQYLFKQTPKRDKFGREELMPKRGPLLTQIAALPDDMVVKALTGTNKDAMVLLQGLDGVEFFTALKVVDQLLYEVFDAGAAAGEPKPHVEMHTAASGRAGDAEAWLRVRLACASGKGAVDLLRRLIGKDGLVKPVLLPDAKVEARVTELSNRFADLDPTHFRYATMTLKLSYRGTALFCELEGFIEQAPLTKGGHRELEADRETRDEGHGGQEHVQVEPG